MFGIQPLKSIQDSGFDNDALRRGYHLHQFIGDETDSDYELVESKNGEYKVLKKIPKKELKKVAQLIKTNKAKIVNQDNEYVYVEDTVDPVFHQENNGICVPYFHNICLSSSADDTINHFWCTIEDQDFVKLGEHIFPVMYVSSDDMVRLLFYLNSSKPFFHKVSPFLYKNNLSMLDVFKSCNIPCIPPLERFCTENQTDSSGIEEQRDLKYQLEEFKI